MIEIAKLIAIAVKTAKTHAPSLRLVTPVRQRRVSFYSLSPEERQILMREVSKSVITPSKKDWVYAGGVDETSDTITATLRKGNSEIRFDVGPNENRSNKRVHLFRVTFKGANAQEAANKLREVLFE